MPLGCVASSSEEAAGPEPPCHRITDYPELEGTHKNNRVQFLLPSLSPLALQFDYNQRRARGFEREDGRSEPGNHRGGCGDTCTRGPIPWRMGRGSPARRGFSVPGHSVLVSSPDLHHPPLSSWHLVPPLGSCFSPQHAGFVADFVIFLLFSFCPLFLALRHHQPFVHIRLPPSFRGSTDFPNAIYPRPCIFGLKASIQTTDCLWQFFFQPLLTPTSACRNFRLFQLLLLPPCTPTAPKTAPPRT